MQNVFHNSTASSYHRARQLVPTELRTEQMSFLSRQIRERAFWSAEVDNAKILSELHSTVQEVISGNLSDADARVSIKKCLSKNGYVPAAGTEGSIKDLGSFRRQQVIIDTNREFAQGYAQHVQAQEMLDMFPCQELVRLRQVRAERPWKNKRWPAAGGRLSKSGRMIAQVNDPIWTRLSRFSTPYPPFDFNSGMGIVPVSLEEAVAEGVMKPRQKPIRKTSIPDINANLEAKLNAPESLWQKMLSEFGGFAERDGDVLRFTDPNGTKAYSSENIVNILSAPLPRIYGNKSPYLQREALVAWTMNPSGIQKVEWTDKAQDMRRLVDRIEPMPGNVPVFRGLSWDTENAEELARYETFSQEVKSGVINGHLFESFSKDMKVAENFAAMENTSVVIKVVSHKNAKDISYCVKKFNGAFAKEKEVLFSGINSFRILGKKKSALENGAECMVLEVEEIYE